ncbi:peptidyl-prolyl cis-trans isomerase-like 4 [Capsaspora owczarzaki ATCC 30864]|uniref:Peptidyl-prolyl cis-trans isomerase n=1 Tax=Capsaspora owczarzaki (strain ATCC 30864) TaxID=595528 RepID=A0A0D2US04_CAPO3|nr:peptidyl-prolyl cis-trans isomerase-like 4 [Capsaspora owczarzaki ATCC 30864]
MSVLVETSLGDIVIDLNVEHAPIASLNFLKLCKLKYYNYCLFHNIQRDFIVQTGDPTNTGRGGTSVFGIVDGPSRRLFRDEIVPTVKHVAVGTVAMAGSGKDGNGSQFYITTAPALESLDGKHTIFGQVVEDESLATLARINDSFCDDKGQPYKDVRIKHTIILDDPFPDPPGLRVPDESPLPSKEQLETGRLAEDEEINVWQGRSDEEIEEAIKDREMYAGAQILEMVGDLPDANIRPPENVLFVCKLNPVTKDEDLHVIFSRFGDIRSCDIIRDPVTNESLCYAFIEFEREADCEEAYFKMDNVLIDDRRIKVDFSQSVARVGGQQQRFDSRRQERDMSLPSGIRLRNSSGSHGAHRDMVFEHDHYAENSSSSKRARMDTEPAARDRQHSSHSGHDRYENGGRDYRSDSRDRERSSRDSRRDAPSGSSSSSSSSHRSSHDGDRDRRSSSDRDGDRDRRSSSDRDRYSSSSGRAGHERHDRDRHYSSSSSSNDRHSSSRDSDDRRHR